MECPRCHNTDSDLFYKLNGHYYCRNCIQFNQVYIEDYKVEKLIRYESPQSYYTLNFNLTPKQMEISHQLKENYINHKDSTVLAVCGSGKTEIVYELINYALNIGDKVCFSTPRKELCIELYERIQSVFKNITISLIYGGHIDDEENQFIICTTHQLYRFEKTGFHLLILDEADAFPYYGNSQLNTILKNCIRGSYVEMSATLNINQENALILNRRYHGYDLPLPYTIILPEFLMKLYLYKFIKEHNKVLIFVPSISDCLKLKTSLSNAHFKVDYVHSKVNNPTSVLNNLKEGRLDALITTTLLERGITVKGVNVIVYKAHSAVFNSRTLIQIAGRAGRKKDYPEGNVCFLACGNTLEMKRCIYTIEKLNTIDV